MVLPTPIAPRTSSGEVVAQAQQANDDGANSVAPRPEGTAPAGTTNADRFRPSADANTNPAETTASVSQSLPPITASPGPVSGEVQNTQSSTGTGDDTAQASPTIQSGAAAGSDDAAGGNAVSARINSIFAGEAGRILPKSNALDAYASYTYSISIYLLSPADYRTMLRKKTRPKGWQLLLQSGGAAVAGGQFQADPQELEQAADGNNSIAEPTLGRNQFFPLDFYIDDVVIKSLTPNKGSGSPHSATNITFKIYEPNGITFLPNLYRAVQQYVAVRGGQAAVRNQVYSSQNFLMAIRFYGYDKNGNLVTASNTPDQVSTTTGTVLQESRPATIEKFIPFQFTDIKFRIQNKITEYDCAAVCPQDLINTGSARGIIPYNIELASQSLKELLTGPANFVSGTKSSGAAGGVVDTGDETARLAARYPAPNAPTVAKSKYNPRQAQVRTSAPATATTRPPNSDADAQDGGFYGDASPAASPAPPLARALSQARSLTISQGLQEALNKFQQEISGPGPDFPQEYPDVYEIDIAEDVIANATLVPPGQFNPRQSAMIRAQTAKESKDGETQSVDVNSKRKPAAAGIPIVQFIDEVCRTSSYILSQQVYWIDSVSGKTVENATPPQTIGWYRIGLEAEPTDKYDTKRNDWAYRIKYSVAAYQVNDVKSDYFPRTEFQGRHKLYNYWFTGENTQILNFEQSFNTLYYITQNAKARPKRTSNYLEADRFYYQTLTSESSQGQDNMKVYDGAASAASWLYSPADQSEVKLQIVGDPAWIFQGELAFGIQDLQTTYSAFLPDGTINPTGREVLFEVAFNTAIDYDLNTGLMDAGKFNFGTNTAAREAGVAGASPAGLPRERYIYQARECISTLSRGRFTQDLVGVLKTFPLENPQAQARNQQQDRAQAQQAAITAQSPNRQPQNPSSARGSLANRTNPVATLFRSANTPLSADSIRTDDFFPTAAQDAPNILPLPAPQAPTSGSEVVGPAAPAQDAVRTLGGASGAAGVGVPQVSVVLQDGSVVAATSTQQIVQLRQQGQVGITEANQAVLQLNYLQQAAENAVTARRSQVGTRDS